MEVRENLNTKSLLFECPSCGFEENADPTDEKQRILYRNEFSKSEVTKLESIDTAVIYDPTLPRTTDPSKRVCKNCGYYEAVFFQADSGRDTDMALVFICTSCKFKWFPPMLKEKDKA